MPVVPNHLTYENRLSISAGRMKRMHVLAPQFHYSIRG
jgi:hypothetical protein